jgi:hypothetical protein
MTIQMLCLVFLWRDYQQRMLDVIATTLFPGIFIIIVKSFKNFIYCSELTLDQNVVPTESNSEQ